MSKTIDAQWVCHDCGVKYGKWYVDGFYVGPASHCATYHVGSCDVCSKAPVPVTEPRDYGGLSATEQNSKETKTLSDLVVHVMDDFPFPKVHQVMKMLEWKWANPDGTSEVPSIFRLRECAEKLLDAVIAKRNSEYLAIGTGGFIAEADEEGLSLRFVLAESESDLSDYQ